MDERQSSSPDGSVGGIGFVAECPVCEFKVPVGIPIGERLYRFLVDHRVFETGLFHGVTLEFKPPR